MELVKLGEVYIDPSIVQGISELYHHHDSTKKYIADDESFRFDILTKDGKLTVKPPLERAVRFPIALSETECILLKNRLLEAMNLPLVPVIVKSRPKDYMHFTSKEEEEKHKEARDQVYKRLNKEYPEYFTNSLQ